MAYQELVKNYERIRDYMRQFYVYGFKSREQYDTKSVRSYDNERRRVESWLGEYMSFHQNSSGKNVFLSVDSREIRRNPFYKSFKAKSFTDKDITLHFYILDILADGKALTSNEILDKITREYLSHFAIDLVFDESTLRKKLKEYESCGLLESEKNGRELRYKRAADTVALSSWLEAVAFFAEENPLGVIGDTLLDKMKMPPDFFGFKHHYLLQALDSQVACDLLEMMREHHAVTLSIRTRNGGNLQTKTMYPVKLYVSTQTGRQYLLCYHYRAKHFLFVRLDTIHSVEKGNFEKKYEAYLEQYQHFQAHLWGVSTGFGRKLEHIEMTIHAEKNEGYIPQRLKREKRHGTVKQMDDTTWLFAADVYDATEMLPWLRTFIGRIVCLKCSNEAVVDTFYADLDEMTRMYKGADHAV